MKKLWKSEINRVIAVSLLAMVLLWVAMALLIGNMVRDVGAPVVRGTESWCRDGHQGEWVCHVFKGGGKK